MSAQRHCRGPALQQGQGDDCSRHKKDCLHLVTQAITSTRPWMLACGALWAAGKTPLAMRTVRRAQRTAQRQLRAEPASSIASVWTGSLVMRRLETAQRVLRGHFRREKAAAHAQHTAPHRRPAPTALATRGTLELLSRRAYHVRRTLSRI